ncbi:hypothetical protein GCM10010420_29930 [Streptomyces glaucosporus]|uniref:Uncharacterized protein n=1 Tax=Streptomyces glaucosporus TaxID=284044 RepID=A0ABP5VEJ3_9ACTN
MGGDEGDGEAEERGTEHFPDQEVLPRAGAACGWGYPVLPREGGGRNGGRAEFPPGRRIFRFSAGPSPVPRAAVPAQIAPKPTLRPLGSPMST